jgi:DNA-binding transcriptional LysR family regulator
MPADASVSKGEPLMPPETLEALLALAEAGSVSGAAMRQHLSQPALTRQLQQLERAVGVPLTRRQGRGVVLTPAGESVAACARRLRDDWRATLAAVHGQGGRPLRLGCGTTVALSLLPTALARLRTARPALPIRVQAGDSAATAVRLLAGEIDAGLVTTAPADRRIRAWPVLRDPVVAVAPRDTTLVRLDLVALAAQPLCLYAKGTGFRAFLDERFAQVGVFPQPVAEMDSLEALREMVCAGLGLSLLPRSVVAAALRRGRLHLVRVPELAGVARTIALIQRTDQPAHPALAELRTALAAAARAARWRRLVRRPSGRAFPGRSPRRRY